MIFEIKKNKRNGTSRIWDSRKEKSDLDLKSGILKNCRTDEFRKVTSLPLLSSPTPCSASERYQQYAGTYLHAGKVIVVSYQQIRIHVLI